MLLWQGSSLGFSSAAHLLPPILTFLQPTSIAQAPRANPGGLYEADARSEGVMDSEGKSKSLGRHWF